MVCVICVVYIDVTVVTLPVLVTAAVSIFIVVHMGSTFMGMSMSVVSIIGEVTVISVVTVVTATVSPCIHVCVVNTDVTVIFFWAPTSVVAVRMTMTIVVAMVMVTISVYVVVVVVGVAPVVIVATVVSDISFVTNAVSPVIKMSMCST